MALFPELNRVRDNLKRKASLTTREQALLSELNEIDRRVEQREIVEGSVRLTKMTGPDDGRCGCCGR